MMKRFIGVYIILECIMLLAASYVIVQFRDFEFGSFCLLGAILCQLNIMDRR